LKSRGITIIVSTPYMDEAEQCDRVALIDRGKILDIDTPQQVTRNFDQPLLAIKATNIYQLINCLRSYEWADSVQPFGEYVHYTDRRGEADTEQLKAYLSDKELADIKIKRIQPNIEDSFINLMQKENKNSHRSTWIEDR